MAVELAHRIRVEYPTAPGFYYDPVLARRVVTWFRAHLRYSRAEWYGRPFELLPWQEAVICRLFATVNGQGRRQYRTVFLGIPKKNGKTELGAGVALRVLCADGQHRPEVYGVASNVSQAVICFNCARGMVDQDVGLRSRIIARKSTYRLSHRRNGGEYRVLSADHRGKQGYSPSAVIFDELHEQRGRELWDALTSEEATSARLNPVIWVMTTAGEDKNSMCFDEWTRALEVQNGTREDPSLLPAIWAAPDDADWRDRRVWQGVNPSWGHTIRPDSVERSFARAEEAPHHERTFRQWRLNQWVDTIINRWLPMAKWDLCGGAVDHGDRPTFGGLDLGQVADLSAMVRVSLDPVRDELHASLRVWMCEASLKRRAKRDNSPYVKWADAGLITLTDGEVTDLDTVEADVLAEHEAAPFAGFGVDMHMAAQMAGHLEAAKVPLVDVKQTAPAQTEALRELYTRVANRKMRQGGNPLFRWAARNAVVRKSGDLMKLDKDKAPDRIDPISALVNAIDRFIRQVPTPPRGQYQDVPTEVPAGAGIMEREW